MMNSMTENGAVSLASTGSAVLNLFFKTVRTTTREQVNALMSAAWNENPLLCLKTVFQLRDCRGGKGEKRVFHDCLRWLISNGHGCQVLTNLEHIPFYGTYKDLFVVCNGNDLELPMLQFYAKTLASDIDLLNNPSKDRPPNTTLAGKWAPSEGGEFDKKYQFARKLTGLLRKDCAPKSVTVKNLGDYRKKVVVPLRKHIDIVEKHMCADDWSGINFATVPSVAMKLYRKAFTKHQETRFASYLADVKSGVAKINASAVFPHQLVKHYIDGGGYDETIELQWREIVKLTKEKFGVKGANAFPLVDVSSSMNGEPMTVAIALGLLLSEIAAGAFHGAMLTFTTQPSVFRVDTGDTLMNKVQKIRAMPWGGSTNLAAAFEVILKTAVEQRVPNSVLPKTLYIFSDMQFDVASPKNSQTNFQHIDQQYAEAGYQRPNVVFWNLRAASLEFPVEQHVPRCALASGFSQSLLDLFLTGDVVSPYAVMLRALTSPRYSRIKLTIDEPLSGE